MVGEEWVGRLRDSIILLMCDTFVLVFVTWGDLVGDRSKAVNKITSR